VQAPSAPVMMARCLQQAAEFQEFDPFQGFISPVFQ